MCVYIYITYTHIYRYQSEAYEMEWVDQALHTSELLSWKKTNSYFENK